MSTCMQRYFAGLVLATYVLALLACTLPSQGSTAGGKPTVNIIAPAAGAQVTTGETVTIQIKTVDAQGHDQAKRGIARVELRVDDVLVATQNLPQPASTYEGTLTWVASTPGPHVLQVQVYNTAGTASDPAAVGVQVVPAGAATITAQPSATQPPPPIVAQPSVTSAPGTMVLPPITPTSGPATVRVAPDGSGDYPSLEAAVAAVPAGSTINLDAGTHNLTKPLNIDKPLRLVGAGMDQTFVVGKAGEHVAQFTGPGSFAADGITFRYEGTAWTRVMIIENGEVDLVRCRFAGAVRDETEKKGGTGLWLRGNTTGRVRECQMNKNGLHGIYVQNQAQPTLEKNVCTDNGYTGIVYFGDAGGMARQNECSGNEANGISVNQQAQPTLEENVCKNNKQVGIYYTGSNGGVARRNECAGNKWGIYVKETANPVLVDNDCHDNATANVVDLRTTESPTRTTGPSPKPTVKSTPKPTNTKTAPALTGKIAFPVLNADRRHYDTWVVNADGTNAHLVVEKMRQPCFRPDGAMLAVNGEAPYQDHIITMNADGSNQRPVSQHVEDSHPSWSPDGLRLAFDTEAAPGGGWQICIVDEPLARKWHVISGPSGIGLRGKYPTWMPDGRIIFNTSDYWVSDTQGGLYAIGDSGGTPARITASGQDTAPAVHGGTVAFMSIRQPGDYEIFTASIYGLDANLKQLTDNSAQDGLPAWSPDGKDIAFVSDGGGAWGLWVMNADGSGRRKLLNLPGTGTLGGDWGTERISWAP